MLGRRDLAWGFAAQGLNVGLWLVMLPVILRYLPPAQVALWLVFVTIVALAHLLELGFQPTLARNVAYVYAGARQLRATGVDTQAAGPLDPVLLGHLLQASRWIYRGVAAAAAAVLWIGGTAYIVSVTPDTEALDAVVLSWFAFSAGPVLNLCFAYLNAFLQGRGDMLQSNQAVVAARVVQLFFGVALVMGGLGLTGLGIASLVGTVAGRWLAHRFFMRRAADLAGAGAPSATEARALVGVLWHNASRFGLVTLSAFLISRATTLVATSRIGLVESAGFALTVHILLILQTLATLPLSLALPRLNGMRAQGDLIGMRRLFSRVLLAALVLFALSTLPLALVGAPLLALIGSTTTLPAAGILFSLCVIFLLELNHGICANLITTDNRVPFVRAGLVTGIGIVLSAWFLAPVFGVVGLVASIAVWQLLYNNWRWPQMAARSLETRYSSLVLDPLRYWHAARH